MTGRSNSEKIVDNPNIDEEAAEKFKSIVEGSMQPLVKHIDKKFTDDGQTYYAETPALDPNLPDQINWWDKFAMCLVRHMNKENKEVVKTTLQINSQHLKDILKKTVKDYPGVSFETKDITLEQPYHVLYHVKEDLENALKEITDEEASEHLKLLLSFIGETFKEEIDETQNFLEHGLVTQKTLWCILRPGTTIFAQVQRQPRAFTLKSYQQDEKLGLFLNLKFVDFDGDDFGTRDTMLLIEKFQGTLHINGLSAYPLSFHSDSGKIREQLLERGRKFEQHAGMHFCNYTGVGTWERDGKPVKFSVNGRVVIDTKTTHRLNANSAFTVSSFDAQAIVRNSAPGLPDANFDFDFSDFNELDQRNMLVADTADGPSKSSTPVTELTDEQRLLANDRVRGFAFSERKWLDFCIENLTPVSWNSECFDQLVLPAAQKDLVQALVTNHVQQNVHFDDIVKGKGRGLVFVLHGPPGVGKTLTAETVAEYCKRPLYMVSAGDLGTYAMEVDERLSNIMDMASTWNAVLLIDEADVFLEARSLLDVNRNSLVSIFLRELEYYQGILFLTSNRVSTFDEAFKSRIHVPLKYNNLNAASRQKIWKNFLHPSPSNSSKPTLNGDGINGHAVDSKAVIPNAINRNTVNGDLSSHPAPTLNDSPSDNTTEHYITVDIDQAGFERLAKADLNGRQIKNIVRTAKSLAQFRGHAVDVQTLEQVVRIQSEFEDQMNPGKESKMWI